MPSHPSAAGWSILSVDHFHQGAVILSADDFETDRGLTTVHCHMNELRLESRPLMRIVRTGTDDVVGIDYRTKTQRLSSMFQL